MGAELEGVVLGTYVVGLKGVDETTLVVGQTVVVV